MKSYGRAKPENFHGKSGSSKFGEAHTIGASNLWQGGKNTSSKFTDKLPKGSGGKKIKGGK